MTTINSASELNRFAAAGKLTAVITAAGNFALYLNTGANKIQEIIGKVSSDVDESLIHDDTFRNYLLQNIDTFNKEYSGENYAVISNESIPEIARELSFPLRF